MMKVKVNGIERELKIGVSVEGVLETLGLKGMPVVVEWNEQALLPREFAGVVLSDGDVLEIVQITAGG